MKLNSNELLVGFLVGMTFMFKFHWWVIPVSLATSILWALGGYKYNGFRRVGVPLVICIMAWLIYHAWYVWISLPLAYGVLCVGYGTQSKFPPDEGSALGRFWWKLTNGNEFVANLLTRGTIYLLLALSFLPVYIT